MELDYYGTAVSKPEYYFLRELESTLLEPIPRQSGLCCYDEAHFDAEGGHITSLNICNRELTSLPASVGNLSFLRGLTLRYNSLAVLPDSICNLRDLTTLDLQENSLENLPKGFGNLRALLYLDLGRNNLASLPEGFGDLHNLETLSLWANSIKALPSSFRNLGKLRKLILSSNTFDSLARALDAIREMEQIREVLLDECQIVGLPDYLQEWLANLRRKDRERATTELHEHFNKWLETHER